MAENTTTGSASAGVISSVTAYLLWGLSPLYWNLLPHYDALEIIAHRIVWSLLFLLLLSGLRGTLPRYRAALSDGRSLLIIGASGSMIALNWLTFIWAVMHNRILETSLGYFFAPLLSMALGCVFLGERPTRVQLIAIVLAASGVAAQALALRELPWVALVLSSTFAVYGLLRKSSAYGSLTGLAAETTLLAPAALSYLLIRWHSGTLHFPEADRTGQILALSTGIVTSVPLLLFAHGARLMRLTTLGLLQYVSPSCTFLLGLVVYGEPFGTDRLISFTLIWTGLALYTWDNLSRQRRTARA